ncbi:MAG TPA: zinc-binding dehydrogenase [Candidatus Kryptonia bacterium]
MRKESYRITKAGSLNNLVLVDEELREPADNEVAVDVKAIGLNFADIFTIFGLYRAAPKSDFIPGIEFSGAVAARGKLVTSVDVGERVMGSIRFGAYTTRLNIDSRYVMRMPDDWTFEQGASFIVQALTAYYALFTLGNLQPRQTVLIHSAAGGVGIYANRIAKKFTAYTIGTVGNAAKINILKEEAYDDVIVRSRNFSRDLEQKLDGRELDLVLDSIGGRFQKESFKFLAASGRMVSYGLSDYASPASRPDYFRLLRRFMSRPRYDSMELIESNKSILGFNLIWLYNRVEQLKDMLCEIQALGLEKPFVGLVFPFDQLKAAISTFQSGKTVGKVVVKV